MKSRIFNPGLITSHTITEGFTFETSFSVSENLAVVSADWKDTIHANKYHSALIF